MRGFRFYHKSIPAYKSWRCPEVVPATGRGVFAVCHWNKTVQTWFLSTRNSLLELRLDPTDLYGPILSMLQQPKLSEDKTLVVTKTMSRVSKSF